jgi:hypothetical protein
MIVFDHRDLSRRGNNNGFRSGIFVTPAVLAGFVKIKYVMGVFDGPDPVSPAFENGNQFFDEGGFACLRSTDYTNDGGHNLVSKIL